MYAMLIYFNIIRRGLPSLDVYSTSVIWSISKGQGPMGIRPLSKHLTNIKLY